MNICAFCSAEYLGRGVKFCSVVCMNLSPETRQKRSVRLKGRKQTSETIAKRIASTNQIDKESKRRSTCLLKHGVSNAASLPEVAERISCANSGKSRPRSEEHQAKIVESRRKNNALRQSAETKRKIRLGLIKHYASADPCVSIPARGRSKNVSGEFNGIWFRSSYEERFLRWCLSKSVKVVSASNKEFRVRYNFLGRDHFYYPDFYLPEYNIVIEVKSSWQLSDDQTIAKLDAACFEHENFTIVDEEVLSDDRLLEEIVS